MAGSGTIPDIQPGDSVSVVAPSGAFDRDRFESGLGILRAQGIEPRFDPGIFERHRYLAGSDERRLVELQDALDDPDTRAVWTARGGYGLTRIVNQLKLPKDPKWVVGFSDVTALHGSASQAFGMSAHGANVTTLPDWSQQARAELFGVLSGDTVTLDFEGLDHRGPAFSGPCFGGNLTVLAAMIGSRAFPDLSGAVLLLEDVGEAPYRLDRCLTQLSQSGALSKCAGVVFGQLTRCEAPSGSGYSTVAVLGEILEQLGIPYASGLQVGHESTSRAVVFGWRATVEGGRMCVARSGDDLAAVTA